MLETTIDPTKIKKGYTFPKLSKLLKTHRSEVIFDSEYINGLIVKAINTADIDLLLLAEMDLFLDRYFSELSESLFISPDDMSAIVWHLIVKMKRIAQSKVVLKIKNVRANGSDCNSDELSPEDGDYLCKLAIDAAISLVTHCSHLLTGEHHKLLTGGVINELLLINEFRLDGLTMRRSRPYVTVGCRESLLLLLQCLAQMTKFAENSPLSIALSVFENFASWETEASIKTICKLSSQVLRTACRSWSNISLLTTREDNVIVNPIVNKRLSTISEESPSQVEVEDVTPSVEHVPLVNIDEDEVVEENNKTEASDANNMIDASIQVGNTVTNSPSRSSSVSSFYVTAVDLSANEANDTVYTSGSTHTQVDMDSTLTDSPTLSKTHNQTTHESANMSLEKSAFHHTVVLEENNPLSNDDDIITLDSSADEASQSPPAAKRLKTVHVTDGDKDITVLDDVSVQKDTGANSDPQPDMSSRSPLMRSSTYTLLATEQPLPSQPAPDLIEDIINETVEDILKSANLDD